MFTIEVKKKGKDERFSFEELRKETEGVHDDCYGGSLVWLDKKIWNSAIGEYYSVHGYWKFICTRCETEIVVDNSSAPTEIIKTAIDGQERKIADNVRVIQKT